MKCYLKYKRRLKILGTENIFAALIIITQNKEGGGGFGCRRTLDMKNRRESFSL